MFTKQYLIYRDEKCDFGDIIDFINKNIEEEIINVNYDLILENNYDFYFPNIKGSSVILGFDVCLCYYRKIPKRIFVSYDRLNICFYTDNNELFICFKNGDIIHKTYKTSGDLIYKLKIFLDEFKEKYNQK